MPPRILLTLGDPCGIGPEVVLKSLLPLRLGGMESMAVVGPRIFWEEAARVVGVLGPGSQGIEVIEPPGSEHFGSSEVGELLFRRHGVPEAARLAVQCLETAVKLAEGYPTECAVVTAPLNKGTFHQIGEKAAGQTEWLAHRLGIDVPVMLLVAGHLRVALMTTHVPIREVVASLNPEMIVRRLRVLQEGLRTRFGMETPQIAMLALNPHGGDGGEPDREEKEILRPALEQARAEGIAVDGLFSADAFFGRRRWSTFDAVLAPYHDQGLVALKMEAAGGGVNATLGLPIVRTSPDHGTAYDIAGRGVASETSTLEAVRMAEQMLEGKGDR